MRAFGIVYSVKPSATFGYCDYFGPLLFAVVVFYIAPVLVGLALYMAVYCRIRFVRSAASKRMAKKRARGSLAAFLCLATFSVGFATAPLLRVSGFADIMAWRRTTLVIYRATFACNPLFYYYFNATLRKAYRVVFGWDTNVGAVRSNGGTG